MEKVGQKRMCICGVGITPTCVGKEPAESDRLVIRGDTPTCVGKSRLPPVSFYQTWVHSHLRGKKIFISSPCIGCLGLLPLAWKKVVPYPVYLACPRITPTRVGKIQSVIACDTVVWDHSHSRGKKSIACCAR